MDFNGSKWIRMKLKYVNGGAVWILLDLFRVIMHHLQLSHLHLKQVALAIECSDFRSPARRRCATEKKGSGSSLDPIRQLGYAGIIIPNIWKSEIMFRTTNWTNQFSMILWSETLSMDHRLNDPQIWFAAMISGETAHLSCMDHNIKRYPVFLPLTSHISQKQTRNAKSTDTHY